MSNYTLIIDAGIPELGQNKLFSRLEAGRVSHTLFPFCYLYEQAKKQGVEIITPDVFLENPAAFKRPLLMSHLASPQTSLLIQHGATALLLYCCESAFIASRFYIGLKKYSGWFKYSLLFSGMKKQASRRTKFLEMHFPQFLCAKDITTLPFKGKKLVALVSSAKGIRNWKKNILLRLLYGLGVKEINFQRWEAIRFFLSRPHEFDLYGFGWDQPSLSGLNPKSLQPIYRGPCAQKIITLRNYKFVLCFENSVFPGYVTEKFFDALFAGTVPVYLGAPNVERYIPAETFVDFRKFKNIPALHQFLSAMDEAAYQGYLSAIRKFLNSEQYRPFTQEAFAKQVLDMAKAESDGK